MGAINQVWEGNVRVQSREEIIEEKLRHILGKLERMEVLGKDEYLKLNPVEATALSLVLKQHVAEYVMKRYAVAAEEQAMEQIRQVKISTHHMQQAQALQSKLMSQGLVGVGNTGALTLGGNGGSGGNYIGAANAAQSSTNTWTGYAPPETVGKPIKKKWWNF